MLETGCERCDPESGGGQPFSGKDPCDPDYPCIGAIISGDWKLILGMQTCECIPSIPSIPSILGILGQH